MLALAAVLLAVDQVTKVVAVATLEGRGPVELLGGLLTLRLVRNPGAAFGFATGFTIALTAVAVVVAVVVVRVAQRLTSRRWAVALGLLLGGAIGNLFDRVFRAPSFLEGHVIDFLKLPFTLVFNVADMAILGAGLFMVLLTVLGVPIDDRFGRATPAAEGEPPGPVRVTEPLGTAEATGAPDGGPERPTGDRGGVVPHAAAADDPDETARRGGADGPDVRDGDG